MVIEYDSEYEPDFYNKIFYNASREPSPEKQTPFV